LATAARQGYARCVRLLPAVLLLAVAACGSKSTGGATSPPDAGPFCGYQNQGHTTHIAAGVDVCLPPVVCNPETCPPQFGECVAGACMPLSGWSGLTTLPEAWATHYCALAAGGCHGVTQVQPAEVTAAAVAARLGLPLCDGASTAGACAGIAASSPMLVGNSEEAIDPTTGARVAAWGLGMTEASGLCYRIVGPGGDAVVALTDRCGGYCKCGGSGFEECGPCVNAADLEPNCPCVGSTPSAMCCGRGCATLDGACDWCASNNHPHFDLDDATFAHVCGDQAGDGSCRISAVSFVACLTPTAWPPGGSGGGTCGASAFHCDGAGAHQDAVPGGSCCCNYNLCPQPDGSCAAPPATCGAGSCACASGQPDAAHPAAGPGCCCVNGAQPQPDGTCM
jgi:hypothetical protein